MFLTARSIIYGPMLGRIGRIRIGIVFDVFVYIFRGAKNWAISCRPAFLTSDSREMAFNGEASFLL